MNAVRFAFAKDTDIIEKGLYFSEKKSLEKKLHVGMEDWGPKDAIV